MAPSTDCSASGLAGGVYPAGVVASAAAAKRLRQMRTDESRAASNECFHAVILAAKTSVWRDFLDFDIRFNLSVRHGRAGQNYFQLFKNLFGRDGSEAKIGGLTNARAGTADTWTSRQNPVTPANRRPPRGRAGAKQ